MTDWDPVAYARFAGLRLRPALDLLAQVGAPKAGDVVDLGCGMGAVAEALRMRFAKRRLLGVDSSLAMLSSAQARGYDALQQIDIAAWQPETPPGLIFSNATLHWLGDHTALMPRLAGFLAPGGVLAVQMPRQHDAPSHRLLREIAAEMFPERFQLARWRPAVRTAIEYARLLAPLGRVDAWETEYVQRLGPNARAHPVRHFTESTAMRPFREKLTPQEAAAYVARYEAALSQAYPAEPDGAVLMPFRRVFFLLTV